MSKTVLVLAAHPDDAEWYAGGTLARLIDEGARVVIAIAADGRKASFQIDGETLAQMRAEEAAAAARVLGAEPPVLLGHADLELDRLPAGVLRGEFIRLIRQQRPSVVIAEDPYCPFEPHPDHRAVAWAALEAVNYATLPLMHPEHLGEGLEPHFVVEKYFYGGGPAASMVVDISATIDRKLAALAEHRSQVAFMVEDVVRQALIAGLQPESVMGSADFDPMAALTMALKAEAAATGRAAGVAFGEAFRYVRFDPMVEKLIVTG